MIRGILSALALFAVFVGLSVWAARWDKRRRRARRMAEMIKLEDNATVGAGADHPGHVQRMRAAAPIEDDDEGEFPWV